MTNRCLSLSECEDGRPQTVKFKAAKPNAKKKVHFVPARTKHRVSLIASNLTSNTVFLTIYIGGKNPKDGFVFDVPPGTTSLFDGHSFVLGSERFVWAKVDSGEIHLIGEAELC